MAHIIVRSLPLIVDLKPGEKAERGTELYTLSIVMVAVAGLFVTARISTRLSSMTSGGQGLGQDDYCVIASLISSVGLSITEIEATIHGYGNHMDDLTKTQIHQALEWFYAAQVLYKVVITLNKMALLVFYLRIFPNQRFRVLCYAGLVFVSFSGIAYIFATIFQCTPVAYYWNRSLGGHCIQSAPFWISYATINIVTDFYILCLPMPLLYRLSLSKKSKWGIMACFAMGGFVCFTTIIRMTTLASSASGTDYTYGPVPATNWSVIEANTGLICTCLPMLKQYLTIIMRLFGGGQPESNSTEYTGKNPRSGNFNSRGYKMSSVKSTKDEIFGTGRQWGAVDSKIVSEREHHKPSTESQENIIGGNKGIQRTVDVEMWHSDGKSDRSLP